MLKNLPANAGDSGDLGSIPGLGRSPEGGHDTPVFLPGESHEQRSLEGYSSWSRKESDMTEKLSIHPGTLEHILVSVLILVAFKH